MNRKGVKRSTVRRYSGFLHLSALSLILFMYVYAYGVQILERALMKPPLKKKLLEILNSTPIPLSKPHLGRELEDWIYPTIMCLVSNTEIVLYGFLIRYARPLDTSNMRH